MFTDNINSLYLFLITWPSLDKWTGLSLILAIISVLIPLIQYAKAWFTGQKARRSDIVRLAQYIVNEKLDHPTKLLTKDWLLSFTRSSAYISSNPPLSKSDISMSLRLAAAFAERKYKGRSLAAKIALLDNLLRFFDKKGPFLMSIASKDPFFAFFLSSITFPFLIFVFQVWSIRLPLAMPLKTIVILIMTTLQIYFALLGTRLYMSWKKRGGHIVEEIEAISTANHTKNTQLQRKSRNLFLQLAFLDKKSTHTIWAPIWEEVLFGIVASALLVTFMPLIFYKFSVSLGITVDAEKIVSYALLAALAILIWFRFLFLKWHAYDYFRQRKLIKELEHLVRDYKLMLGGHIKFQGAIKRDIFITARELWAMTGNMYYKNIKKKIQNIENEIREVRSEGN